MPIHLPLQWQFEMATPEMKKKSAKDQLAGFIARFTPEVAAQARKALDRMRELVPGAVEMVYDNYNALVIGFGPTERASEAIFSIILYPRWVSLCFLQGASLDDPAGVLRGDGNVVRHVVLEDTGILDQPAVAALIEQAIENAPRPFEDNGKRQLVIKSIAARQRPRRPGKKE